MSHFTVGVLVPADTTPENLEARVAERLAKYDENTEVEPYRVYMDEKDVASMAEYYKVEPTETHTLIGKMRDWNGAKESGVDEQGIWYTRTYNPDSKWDWWQIGGRWAGALRGADVIPVSQIEEGTSFYAMVTDNGEWHQKGNMGWFGISTDEQDPNRWAAEQAEILSGHRDHLLVMVDCHI